MIYDAMRLTLTLGMQYKGHVNNLVVTKAIDVLPKKDSQQNTRKEKHSNKGYYQKSLQPY